MNQAAPTTEGSRTLPSRHRYLFTSTPNPWQPLLNGGGAHPPGFTSSGLPYLAPVTRALTWSVEAWKRDIQS